MSELIGKTTWHCSEEDSGPDVGVVMRLSPTSELWIGELLNSDESGHVGFVVHDENGRRLIGPCDYDTGRDLVEEVIAPVLRSQAETIAKARALVEAMDRASFDGDSDITEPLFALRNALTSGGSDAAG